MSCSIPAGFVSCRSEKLIRFSTLQNFPAYLRNTNENISKSLLSELFQRQYYKPKGRPPYSADMLRYALLLRYTSAQVYKYLLEKFPLPSFSMLKKLKQDCVYSLKALQVFHEAGKFSDDVILIADEMYLERTSQYHSEEFIGADNDGILYKDRMVFMVKGLESSLREVIKACLEVSITGQ